MVDDSEFLQKVTVSIIEKIKVSLLLNFDIISAVNGEEGLNRFMQSPKEIKLILMDIQMPVMNGYESAIRIREYEQENKIEPPCYIVGLSGEESTNHDRRCRLSHMNESITKPINRSQVEQLLLTIFSSTHANTAPIHRNSSQYNSNFNNYTQNAQNQ